MNPPEWILVITDDDAEVRVRVSSVVSYNYSAEQDTTDIRVNDGSGECWCVRGDITKELDQVCKPQRLRDVL